MLYNVRFIQSYEYEIEAEDENEAFEKGKEEFYSDVYSPIANTIYDDYEIEEVEEN